MSDKIKDLLEALRLSYDPKTGRARCKRQIPKGVLMCSFFPAYVKDAVPETSKEIPYAEWATALSVLTDGWLSNLEGTCLVSKIHATNTSTYKLLQDVSGSLYYVGTEWCYKFSTVKAAD